MVLIDIVGCGEVTLQFHGPILRHFIRMGKVSINGCYDKNIARAKSIGNLLGAKDWNDAPPKIPSERINAVLIATPPRFHAENALPYIEAGKDALIEKPFVCRLVDAIKIEKAALNTRSRVLVGHVRRYFTSVLITRQFIKEGGLGKINKIIATEGARWSWSAASSYAVSDPFGGVLYDNGSHVLDTILYILGADNEKSADFEIINVEKDYTLEPSQNFRAEFIISMPGKKKIPVYFAVSRTRSLASLIRLEGDHGTILLSGQAIDAPRIKVGRRIFRLKYSETFSTAKDLLGAIKLEHLDFLKISRDSCINSPLECHRFLLLTNLLERLGGIFNT